MRPCDYILTAVKFSIGLIQNLLLEMKRLIMQFYYTICIINSFAMIEMNYKQTLKI